MQKKKRMMHNLHDKKKANELSFYKCITFIQHQPASLGAITAKPKHMWGQTHSNKSREHPAINDRPSEAAECCISHTWNAPVEQ